MKPYYFTFTTHAKGRWVGSKVIDVFSQEFQSETPEFYVSILSEHFKSSMLYTVDFLNNRREPSKLVKSQVGVSSDIHEVCGVYSSVTGGWKFVTELYWHMHIHVTWIIELYNLCMWYAHIHMPSKWQGSHNGHSDWSQWAGLSQGAQTWASSYCSTSHHHTPGVYPGFSLGRSHDVYACKARAKFFATTPTN